MDASADPVIFSHSNARAVWDHPRNIPDDLMRACAERGDDLRMIAPRRLPALAQRLVDRGYGAAALAKIMRGRSGRRADERNHPGQPVAPPVRAKVRRASRCQGMRGRSMNLRSAKCVRTLRTPAIFSSLP